MLPDVIASVEDAKETFDWNRIGFDNDPVMFSASVIVYVLLLEKVTVFVGDPTFKVLIVPPLLLRFEGNADPAFSVTMFKDRVPRSKDTVVTGVALLNSSVDVPALRVAVDPTLKAVIAVSSPVTVHVLDPILMVRDEPLGEAKA